MLENALKNYLLENSNELIEVVNELNAWNGSLEDLKVYQNDDEFFDMFFSNNPTEAVRATQYGEYNYNDPYVKFNGYGNLDTYDQYDYEDLLKESIGEIIDLLIENENYISLSDEIEEIFESNSNEEIDEKK